MGILITLGSFQNKGAEALILTARRFLRERFPSCELFAPSCDPSSQQRVRSEDIRAVAIPTGRHRLRKLADLVRSYLGLGNTNLRRWLEHDLPPLRGVVDISGFAYGDQWGWRRTAHGWWFYSAIDSMGAAVVFLPQAWGAFTGFKIRLAACQLLKRATLVYARDRESYQALADLNAIPDDRLRMAPDIAFHFRGDPPETGKRILTESGIPVGKQPILALTPNMRAFERSGNLDGSGSPYLDFLCHVVRDTVGSTDCLVVLVPHETKPSGHARDDCWLTRRIREDTGLADRVFALEGEHTAAQLKSIIANADFLVGSRYHSLIAALSHRVPAVAIGWSHKYAQLMRSVGLGEFVADVRDFDPTRALAMVKRGWAERDALRAQLVSAVPELEKASWQALEAMAGCLATGMSSHAE